MIQYIYTGIAVIIAVVLHEFAHGFVSYKLGDPTPKSEGRLSLNPLVHLDLFGTIALFVFGFGWAKPVQVNPRYYKNPKTGMMFTALAGPGMNFVVAFISLLLWKFGIAQDLLSTIVTINIGLGVFNLIPIPPLDGSKILAGILPENLYMKWLQYERHFSILLLLVLFTGILDKFLIGAITGVVTIMAKILGIS